jgi:hypothetical protein
MTAPPAPAADRQALSPDPAEGCGESRASAPRGRGGRVALFLAGLAAGTALLALVGWGAVAENLRRIDGFFVFLIALYGLAQAAFAIGWWTLVIPPRPVRFGEIFAAYLGGDSVNYFTSIGGEPVKAHLLSGRMGFNRALATIWVNRNADVLAQWLFLIAGAAVALSRFTIPAVARYLVVGGLLLLGSLAIGFTFMQRKGFFGPVLRAFSHIRPLAGRLRRLENRAREVDGHIRVYYHAEEHRFRFLGAVAWGFLGWCGGLIETWIVLRLLAPRAATFEAAFAVESLAMILNSVLIFVPAKIGSAEGVRVAVTTLVGLTAAQGAAYALVRRARELLWLAPGVVVLLKRHVLDVGHMRLEPVELEEKAR